MDERSTETGQGGGEQGAAGGVRAGWTHHPASLGHPERYERSEPAMADGAVLSLEIINYYGTSLDPSWTGWIRLLAGFDGHITVSHDLGRGAEAAQARMEKAARVLGSRLIALGTNGGGR